MQVTAINQLWVADITYLRLGREFVYLAVVLDVFSRRVVGWSLGRSLQVALPLAALNQAIAERQPGRGLVHHSIAAHSMPATITCSAWKKRI